MPTASCSPTDEPHQFSAPAADDFRRIGVRHLECRQEVIRLAAQRTARRLASRQLTSPSPQGLRQLSRVATSAYRLLDPRRRADPLQRVLVARILSDSLVEAAPVYFADQAAQRFVSGSMLSPPSRGPAFAAEPESDSRWRSALGQADLVASRSLLGRIHRGPQRCGSSGWVAGIAVAVAAIGIGIGWRIGWPTHVPASPPPQADSFGSGPAAIQTSLTAGPSETAPPPTRRSRGF